MEPQQHSVWWVWLHPQRHDQSGSVSSERDEKAEDLDLDMSEKTHRYVRAIIYRIGHKILMSTISLINPLVIGNIWFNKMYTVDRHVKSYHVSCNPLGSWEYHKYWSLSSCGVSSTRWPDGVHPFSGWFWIQIFAFPRLVSTSRKDILVSPAILYTAEGKVFV